MRCEGERYSFFTGPFSQTESWSRAVDFSSAIYTDGYTIVVPLRFEAQVWSFLEPLSSGVWVLSILSIPTFLLAMGLAEYAYCGNFHWGIVAGFVLRNVFLENVDKLPDRAMYQREGGFYL